VPRFRPHEHLRKPQEFQAVYDRRRSSADGTLIVYARENGLPQSRLGLSVSKKFGGAVQRNRIRRLLREAYRLTKEAFPTGYDLVLIPRPQEEYTLAYSAKVWSSWCVCTNASFAPSCRRRVSINPVAVST
jgi:ribonuclease P protein component